MLRIDMKSCWSRNEAAPDKENEDWLEDYKCPDFALVIAVDGVTRSRDHSGAYPEGGPEFARLVGHVIKDAILAQWGKISTDTELIRNAIEESIRAAALFNQQRGLYGDRLDYEFFTPFAATVAVALFNFQRKEFTAASLGDAVILQGARNHGFYTLLSRDQLVQCDAYMTARYGPEEKRTAAQNQERLRLQRQHVCNARSVRIPDEPHINFSGYGVINGDKAALDFLDIRTGALNKGDLFLVSTDAIRAIIHDQGIDHAAAYHFALTTLRESMTDPQAIVKRIREKEKKHGIRSDDASLHIVEII